MFIIHVINTFDKIDKFPMKFLSCLHHISLIYVIKKLCNYYFMHNCSIKLTLYVVDDIAHMCGFLSRIVRYVTIFVRIRKFYFYSSSIVNLNSPLFAVLNIDNRILCFLVCISLTWMSIEVTKKKQRKKSIA